jgi:hypothetical protein
MWCKQAALKGIPVLNTPWPYAFVERLKTPRKRRGFNLALLSAQSLWFLSFHTGLITSRAMHATTVGSVGVS